MGATPNSIHFRFGFSINQRFWGSPIYGNPHVASNWFSHIISTSVSSDVQAKVAEFHQKSRCSTAKFEVLPKVQGLSHHFKFQISGSFQRFRYFQIFRYFQFQVLHYLIMEKSSVPFCRNLAVRK